MNSFLKVFYSTLSDSSAGSPDRFVYAWDTDNNEYIIWVIPGHDESVKNKAIHLSEPIIL